MKKPTFLLIGSMKCGTSSIYSDICEHPNVFLPSIKEPKDLLSDYVLNKNGLEKYLKLYSSCPDDQICGDASTHYSKFPKHKNVPKRAMAVLGSKIKIIYVIRNIYDRIESHYAHERSNGTNLKPINEEIKVKNNTLLHFSNYNLQVIQWLEIYPKSNIKIVIMEDYIKNKIKTVDDIRVFIGLDKIDRTEIKNFAVKLNSSDSRYAPTGLFRVFFQSDFYLRNIRERFPISLRKKIKKMLFKPASSYKQKLNDSGKAYIREKLQADINSFCKEYDIDVKEII